MTDRAIGVDIGGTKMVAGLVVEGRVVDRRRLQTPSPRGGIGGEEALVTAILDVVEGLGADVPVGVAIASLVDRDGALSYAPNLAVQKFPLGEVLTARLGRPVPIQNDATAAGVAEHRLGAGRGYDDVVMVTIGTGVGGAVVSGGRLVVGTNGFGAELGHTIVDEGGPVCACGNRGCLEAVASGTALERVARAGLADAPDSPLASLDTIRGRDVTDAAAAGDGYAVGVIERIGWWLGIGLAGLVNIFDPALVIVGGGATDGAGRWLLPAASASMRTRVMGAANRPLPDVVPAALGDDAGLIGAALTAEDRR